MEKRTQANQVLHQLHKFGGSSLADAACYQRVIAILREYSHPNDLIVVSAAGNTTNQLIEWVTLNQQNQIASLNIQQALRNYQLDLITTLLPPIKADQLIKAFMEDLCRLTALLDLPMTEANYAEIIGQGEIWAARLLAALLQHHNMNSCWLDARDFLRADQSALPQIDEEISRLLLKDILVYTNEQWFVITGFICRNKEGDTLLLGRNSSDYSATQIGVLAGVDRVTIWSDVAGIYSADPHQVNDAFLLPLLRFDEANELARLAAPILHTRTLQPLVNKDIDLYLRCSHHPSQGSTRIERILASGLGAKIITSHNDVCLLNIRVAEQYDFNALQGELEILLQQLQLEPLALNSTTDRLLLQLCYTTNQIQDVIEAINEKALPCSITLEKGISLVAMVGANVGKNPLHSYRFYQQIKDLPVEFIWHAHTAISMVAVLRGSVTNTLLTKLHQSLFKAEKRIGLVLLGKGHIASCWLDLFAKEQKSLSTRSGFDFILAGVINSKKIWLDNNGLDARQVLAHFDKHAQYYEQRNLIPLICHLHFDDLVILDITANEELAQVYPHFAHYGFHVISANKIAGTVNSHTYHMIRDAFIKTQRHWLYNATVGAGLPINYTIRDLCDSGDTIFKISGIFSSTLSWLFLQYDGSVPFIMLVEQAWQQGLTEPDPRIDLSGQDIVRKLVILVREAGYELEAQQVNVESLVPFELQQGTIEDFFEHGHLINEQMDTRFKRAQKNNRMLRYVARFDTTTHKASVRIETIDKVHPLASILPCDNIFAIESRWYRDNPLIIRGPGAGREITAGAIQLDINRLARLL